MSALGMPAEIAGAVNDVCAKVKMAVKEHVNKHGGYKYVSVDKFYEDMGPLMAEAGLFLVMNEAAAESDGKWLTLTFHIYLYHKSGAAFGPVVRSQGVLANGPQAYAAAQSFAEKYFIRQLFKVPTGEDDTDADSHGKAPIPVTAPKRAPKAETVTLLSADESSRERDVLLKNLTLCTSSDEMLAWAQNTAHLRNKLHTADREALKAAYLDLQKSLKKEAA